MIKMANNAISSVWWFISDKQYYLIIHLDVRNTFNSADWDAILVALEEENIPGYLIDLVRDCSKDRLLLYDKEAGRNSYALTVGVSQGSMLEPTPWNVR